MKWISFAFLCVFIALSAAPAHAYQFTRVQFDNAPFEGKPTTKVLGVLHTPDGKGPFPAVVVLQACGGWDDNVATDWPKYLVSLGYAALGVDILTSRKVKSACQGQPIPIFDRLSDIYGALAFLERHPAIDRERIYAIGFSWGGMHVLEAMLQQRPRLFAASGAALLKGGVAVYPDCKTISRQQSVFYAPVLIVGAEFDDWTPVSQCKAIVEGQGEPRRLSMEVLPGAHHGFDQFTQGSTMLGARKVLGHTIAPNRAATNRARELVKAFLENPK